MQSTRVVVLVAAAVGLAALTAAAAVVLARDAAEPVTGNVIAYSCKEQNNRWYAICSMGAMHRSAASDLGQAGDERPCLVTGRPSNRLHAEPGQG